MAAGYHLMKSAMLEGKKTQAGTAERRTEDRGVREEEEEAPSGFSTMGPGDASARKHTPQASPPPKSSLAPTNTHHIKCHIEHMAFLVHAHTHMHTNKKGKTRVLTVLHKQLHNRSHFEHAGLSECAQP